MSQIKKVAVSTPWDNLLSQVDDLTSAKPEAVRQLLADLVLPRIDRIRLFASQAGAREVVREIAVPAVKTDRDALTRKGLRKIDDTEITVALTLKEDGTISLGVESEPALVGQDLSVLENITYTDDEVVDFADPETDDFISAQEIADELGVAKTTITRRIKNNKLLGYQGFKRDWLIPRAQFKGGNVVPGVAEMIALFDNEHRETWFFLSSKFFYGDDNPCPIDRLRALKRNDKAGFEACLVELESVKSSHDHGDHF